MHNTCSINKTDQEKCNDYLNVINWNFMDLALNLKLDDCDGDPCINPAYTTTCYVTSGGSHCLSGPHL